MTPFDDYDRSLTPADNDPRIEIALDRLRHDPDARYTAFARFVQWLQRDADPALAELEAGNYNASGALLREQWQVFKRSETEWLIDQFGEEECTR